MKFLAAAIISGLLCSASANAQQAQPAPLPEWGTIIGRVVYDGKGQFPAPRMLRIPPGPGRPAQIDDESLVINKQNNGLANVFVYLRTKPSKIHPGYEKSAAQVQTLRHKDLRFVPHALAMWNKDSLEIRNEENTVINVVFHSVKQSFNILIFPAGNGDANNFEKKQFITGELRPTILADGIHHWMRGPFLVRDNPYFCVTDERGIFCIPNLPTDEVLEFVFWHERREFMSGMANQAPDPAHNTVLDQRSRMHVRLIEPVLDLGEFLADPKKFKE